LTGWDRLKLQRYRFLGRSAVHGIRRSLSAESHTYCAREKIPCHGSGGRLTRGGVLSPRG